MDIVVGALVWGGLLVALLWWRGGRPAPPAPHTDPVTRTARGAAPAAPPRPVRQRATERETEALVDGLVIGHFLTRDHHQRRLEELDEERTSARSGEDRHHLAGEDDLEAETDLHGPAGAFGVAAAAGHADPTDPFDLEVELEGEGFHGFEDLDDLHDLDDVDDL